MPEPWTIAEIVAQLKFNSIPMTEIAGIDSYQLRWLHSRARDKTGRLIRGGRDGLPDWCEVDADGRRVISNPTSFGRMFVGVAKARGWGKEATVASWREWVKANPQFEAKGNW